MTRTLLIVRREIRERLRSRMFQVSTAISVLVVPRPQNAGRFTAFLGIVLTYTFVAIYGGMVLNGVAEEKSTRVAEVLLSAVRPNELLTGKVLGIGTVALLQGLITAAAAFAAG